MCTESQFVQCVHETMVEMFTDWMPLIPVNYRMQPRTDYNIDTKPALITTGAFIVSFVSCMILQMAEMHVLPLNIVKKKKI